MALKSPPPDKTPDSAPVTRVNPDDREDVEAAPGEGQPMPSADDDATTAKTMVDVLGPPLTTVAARIEELLRDPETSGPIEPGNDG